MNNIPSKDAVLQWINENPNKTTKRDIAKAFGVKGADRIDLKRILKELTAEGHLHKDARGFRDPDELPPVSVIRCTRVDQSGDIWAEPLDWQGKGDAPRILFVAKEGGPAISKGHQLLCRLSKSSQEDVDFEARLIRKIADGPEIFLGIYRVTDEGGRIIPVDKKKDREWKVSSKDAAGAKDGELVEAQQSGPKGRMGLPAARVLDRLGDPMAPKSISLIAIHQHGIPDRFPDDVVEEAENAQPVELGERTDLRHLPLFTIDPSDARDHDDAICAAPDDDPKNPGGHIVWVGIADVAHYVQPGSALDKEARLRGNSSYFPDRVVPMLPDALSGDLCSLHEGVDRACMAVRIILNSMGEKIHHEFHRGLMRSPASLSYEQAQAAHEGTYDDATKPLEKPIADLFAAYNTALKARAVRAPLNLDLPERKIVLSDVGKVLSVDYRARFDAHKLVEEFMVMANVCAAETLESKRVNLLYRVHEEPSPEKLNSLREVAIAAGMNFAKGQVLKTEHINRLLRTAEGTEDSELINMSVLRAMTQAYYGPSNMGHFGLNLKRYAHFTSPIRRYADLIVHRALVTAHKFGDDGLRYDDIEVLKETGEWISQTERRSMLAERDTTDRYLAAFLEDRIGAEFSGRVSGIAKFGLFVKLDETGADGIIPLSHLGREFWAYREQDGTLKGEDSGRIIAVGMPCKVSLVDATALTGGLTLEMLELDGKPMPKGSSKSKSSKGRKHSRKKNSRKKGKPRRKG